MITLEDIKKAKETMEKQDIPRPYHVYLINEHGEDEFIKLDDAGYKRVYEIWKHRKDNL